MIAAIVDAIFEDSQLSNRILTTAFVAGVVARLEGLMQLPSRNVVVVVHDVAAKSDTSKGAVSGDGLLIPFERTVGITN
jgi:hypothetical protein